MTQIEADNAFRCIESELQAEPFQSRLVTCNTDKQVPRVKQGIIELKDRICCSSMIMKYKKIPQRFMIKIVKEVTKIMNSLPKENSVYMIQSPCHIVRGILFRLPQISMGKYVQGNIGGLNDTDKKTVDSIYIGQDHMVADTGYSNWILNNLSL